MPKKIRNHKFLYLKFLNKTKEWIVKKNKLIEKIVQKMKILIVYLIRIIKMIINKMKTMRTMKTKKTKNQMMN